MLKKCLLFLFITIPILFVSLTAYAEGAVDEVEVTPISGIVPDYSASSVSDLDIPIEELDMLKLTLESLTEPGVIEPEVLPPESEVQSWKAKGLAVSKNSFHQRKSELPADYIAKLRYLYLGDGVSNLERAHLTNIGMVLMELAGDDPEAASLMRDVYFSADQVASNFSDTARIARIRERVESDMREGLISGRYDGEILVALKGSSSQVGEAILNFYGGLDEIVHYEDFIWLKRVTYAIENNIKLGILAAIREAQSPIFQDITFDAYSEPEGSPVYDYLH